MNLGYKLSSQIEYKGRRYRLDLAFDNVLRMYDIWREDVFNDLQKLILSVELLAGRRASRLPLRDQEALFQCIRQEFISPGGKVPKPGEPIALDYTQDAALIYAAFLQTYGVDLDKQRGRMDWRIFTALFEGLPDDTRIREVIHIRKCPIPKPNEHNADEIKALMEAKAFYAIRTNEREAKKTLQEDINRLASTLISQAKAGDRNGGRRR